MSDLFVDKIYPIPVYCIQRYKMNSKKSVSAKTKHRSQEELKSLTNRLNKISGQINGIKKMLEENAYCTDILNQVSAAQGAFNAFSRELLANHIETCVVQNIKDGNEDIVDELLNTLQKLMK